MRELGSAADTLQGVIEWLLQFRGKIARLLGNGPLHPVEVADNDRQQVVEVVRDAAGELTHSLEPLRLAQGVLRFATQCRLRLEAPDIVQRRAQRQHGEGHCSREAYADQAQHPDAQSACIDLASCKQAGLVSENRVE